MTKYFPALVLKASSILLNKLNTKILGFIFIFASAQMALTDFMLNLDIIKGYQYQIFLFWIIFMTLSELSSGKENYLDTYLLH